MVQVRQIQDLEVHSLRSGFGERLDLLNDFIDGSGEAVRSQLAHFAADFQSSSLDLRFILAHAQNLCGRKHDRFATTSGMFTGPSHPLELGRRIVQR